MKVQVYTKNDFTKKYTNTAYGSALYVGKNRVLTNAHVILDEKNKVVAWIELCGIVDPTKRPSCFSSAKVLWYDEDIDLALLESQVPIVWNAVKLAAKNPQIDDMVIIKWFPNNGLDTITTTRWFVWGNYQEYLKLDADLDGGNSGWWWFNKEYELIGIPTFYVEWGENLGYIIPIEKIKEFLNRKWVITQVKNSFFDAQFSDYLSSTNKVLNSGVIKTPVVSIKRIVWFDIIDYRKWANDTYSITYQSSKSDATISIDITNMADSSRWSVFASSIKRQLRSLSEQIGVEDFTAAFWWVARKGISFSDEEAGVEWRTYYAVASGNVMLQINIIWSKKETSSVIAKKFMSKISFKPTWVKQNYLWRYGFLDFSSQYGNVSQGVDWVFFDPASEYLVESEYSFRELSSSSEYMKIISWLEKLAKTTDEKIVAVKNTKWSVFHIIYAKSEDNTEASRMIVMFLAKDKEKLYINGLNIQFYEQEDIKKRIIHYVDNLIIYDSEKTHVGMSTVAEALK